MSSMAEQRERIEAAAEGFRARYDRRPALVASVPGRINLIGEHTDYNGLPVLPIAIDRWLHVAAAPRDDTRARLASSDDAYRPAEYDLAEPIRPGAGGDWTNYHRAAAAGLAGLFRDGLRGGDFFIDSAIPAGSGLSSSSALVVGSGLALLALHDVEVPALSLAETLAAAERFVGTQSGGMDQAICLLAEAGRALRIDFDPLRAHPVPIPAGAAFVVCHSLVTAQKSGAAQRAYNHRVVECRLACRVLERTLGASLPRPLAHLGDLARLFSDRPLSEFVGTLESALPPRPLTLGEIAAIIGTSTTQLSSSIGGSPQTNGGASFALLQRGRHVLTEAERVERAESALAGGDWLALASLMDASHASCRDDYEVSCPELEALIGAAKNAGALGSRLTGAGFGGCTIHLVDAADLPLFCTMIERAYYRKLAVPPNLEYCFVVTPSAGGAVTRL
jgi:N-acetylgalactosamine kinase